MTDIYMDWDEPGAGTLFRGDDVLHISLDVDWSDTDHPIIPPSAHDFLNELLAMPARIIALEAALQAFAEYGRIMHPDMPPDTPIFGVDRCNESITLVRGDFRRAAEALEGTDNG